MNHNANVYIHIIHMLLCFSNLYYTSCIGYIIAKRSANKWGLCPTNVGTPKGPKGPKACCAGDHLEPI